MSSIDEDEWGSPQVSEEKETTAQGNKIVRAWAPKDRYWFDGGAGFKFFDLTVAGWSQYDTPQDAPYFGQWINHGTMQTVCYCEGDVNIVTCADKAHYEAELQALDKWRDEL